MLRTTAQDRPAMLRAALLRALLGGLVLGGVSSLTNAAGSPFSPDAGTGVRVVQGVGALIGSAWAWSLVAAGCGWVASSRRLAVGTATLALMTAAVVYYLGDTALGIDDALDTGELRYWLAVSAVVGPVMGLLGHLARSPRWWSILPGLAVTVGIFPIAAALGVSLVSPSLWWPGLVAWTTALALALVVTVRWLRLVGGRPWRAAPS